MDVCRKFVESLIDRWGAYQESNRKRVYLEDLAINRLERKLQLLEYK